MMATHKDLANNNHMLSNEGLKPEYNVANTTNDDIFSLHHLDDERLKAAVRMAEVTGEVTPLLKQEIRYLIQARRLSEGKSEEMEEDAPHDSSNQLSEDDYMRRDKRKNQNRVAAQKYRQKKKEEKDILELQILLLEVENGDLQQNVARLNNELWVLKQYISKNSQNNTNDVYITNTPEIGNSISQYTTNTFPNIMNISQHATNNSHYVTNVPSLSTMSHHM